MKNENTRFQNVQVRFADTRVIGHTHDISIRIGFDCWVLYIDPKRNWFSDDGKRMPFYDLFDCFDIDCEDGASLESLTGKYCRLEIDRDFRVVAIYHITKDTHVLVKDLVS